MQNERAGNFVMIGIDRALVVQVDFNLHAWILNPSTIV